MSAKPQSLLATVAREPATMEMASLFDRFHTYESSCDPLVHVGPEEFARHSRVSLFAAEITTSWIIMVLMNNSSAQIHVVGYHRFVRGASN